MTSSSTPIESLLITTKAMESMETDKIESFNALSQVPQGVLIKGDLTSYVDCEIEDLESLAIYSQLKSLCDKSGKIKPKYIRVYEKGFHNVAYFLEDFEEEHVRIFLSCVHGGNMYLDRSHTITKEAIHEITSFCQTDEVPKLRTISKETLIALTKTTTNGHSISINNITDPGVRFATMVIGYQIFHSSKMNNVPSVVVHVAYRMMIESAYYDLCEAVRSQLKLNLESIKKDNSQKFKYGQLLIGLFFYFQNFILGIIDIQWSKDIPVTMQIKNNIKAMKNTFPVAMIRYFNEFKKMMRMRLRLSDEVVKHFEKDTCFIVTIEFFLMEAIKPREEEMEEMSYEVSYKLLISYDNNLLASPKDTKKKRLGTYQERIAPAQPSSAKEKKKKVDQPSSMTTGTRVTRSIQIKKEPVPKVYAKKQAATKKRGRHLIIQVKSEETDTEEESKKMKLTGKNSKPIGDISQQSTSINVTSFKPMSDFERTLKTLGRKWFDNVKEYFDSFDEGRK